MTQTGLLFVAPNPLENEAKLNHRHLRHSPLLFVERFWLGLVSNCQYPRNDASGDHTVIVTGFTVLYDGQTSKGHQVQLAPNLWRQDEGDYLLDIAVGFEPL
jgi:hypothetical protein